VRRIKQHFWLTISPDNIKNRDQQDLIILPSSSLEFVAFCLVEQVSGWKDTGAVSRLLCWNYKRTKGTKSIPRHVYKKDFLIEDPRQVPVFFGMSCNSELSHAPFILGGFSPRAFCVENSRGRLNWKFNWGGEEETNEDTLYGTSGAADVSLSIYNPHLVIYTSGCRRIIIWSGLRPYVRPPSFHFISFYLVWLSTDSISVSIFIVGFWYSCNICPPWSIRFWTYVGPQFFYQQTLPHCLARPCQELLCTSELMHSWGCALK